jgi:hypothetical protein
LIRYTCGVSIARELRTLDRVFRAALVAASFPSIALVGATACSASTTTGSSADTAADASSGVDADIADAPARECKTTLTMLDAEPDAYDCALGYPCGMPRGIAVVGCDMFYSADDGAPTANKLACRIAPGQGCESAGYVVPDGASITIECDCPGGGRRPRGLVRRRDARVDASVGGYLARLAHEEDASIVAFDILQAELRAHGAPGWIVRAAGRARRDEVRHARVMTSLAASRGGRAPRARVRRGRARRSLVAIAIENSTEGCVRETYGALLAKWQSLHATDGEIARAFATIAADEARHAALSWAVARWIDARLDARARARVQRARARAVERLEHTLACVDASRLKELGLPDAQRSRVLLRTLAQKLAL